MTGRELKTMIPSVPYAAIPRVSFCDPMIGVPAILSLLIHSDPWIVAERKRKRPAHRWRKFSFSYPFPRRRDKILFLVANRKIAGNWARARNPRRDQGTKCVDMLFQCIQLACSVGTLHNRRVTENAHK